MPAAAAPPAEPGRAPYLSTRELCELLSISRTTLYNLVDRDRFPRPVRLGPRLLRWRRADLDAFLAKAQARRR